MFDISEYVEFGKDNEILVRVNNAQQLDVMPLVGDFNFYGGIYRDVYLIITEEEHISLTDYASPGVYLIQNNVTKESANLSAKVMLNNFSEIKTATISVNILDGNKNIISKSSSIELIKGENISHTIDFTINNPRLWNSIKDPFMFRSEITLMVNGEEKDKVAHMEDITRPTVAASFLGDDNPLNQHSDLIAWNKYYGWYGGGFEQMGSWADGFHKRFPQYKLGVSEYGAGASIYHQQEELKVTDPTSWWHPENWQTAYHEGNWKAINERKFIWGSFIWNLFDFGAAHRTEGDRPGINDKGLVTFDRKVKKDAFYFYKANWNKEEPMVFIAEKRNSKRNIKTTSVKVFTNFSEGELWLNGKKIGSKKADEYATIIWNDIQLEQGINIVEVKVGTIKTQMTDKAEWEYIE